MGSMKFWKVLQKDEIRIFEAFFKGVINQFSP